MLMPGFQAVAVYRFGVWVDGVRPRLVRWPLRKIYRLMHAFVRNVYGIELFWTVRAGRRLRIGHQSGIVIHRNVTLGDDCLIRHNVTIGIAGPSTPREEVPVLGDRVAIGAGAVILSPARIGDDVVIGPNVVVRSHVPPNSTVMPHAPEIKPRARAGRVDTDVED
jgi:serine O-acetyltransferase